MARNSDELNDRELNQLLKFASQPKPSADFEARLMQKIESDIPTSNVIAFPQRGKTSLWLAGLPLAASLLIGIWLGANGSVSDFLPSGNEDSSLNIAGLFSSSNSSDDIDNLSEDILS
jgi:hypothetical protein